MAGISVLRRSDGVGVPVQPTLATLPCCKSTFNHRTLSTFPVLSFIFRSWFLIPQVMLWGLLLMCHAACKSFAGLAVVRTLLGALESACNPAMMIIFGMYYTRSEQPFRMGSWIGFGGIAYILNGIISYGIGHVHAKTSTWRLIYLVLTVFLFWLEFNFWLVVDLWCDFDLVGSFALGDVAW